ncbi:PREDICTED: uncharacterized protein C4orf17 homolog [Chinchilla lanigera]|uniref:Chromosome 4 open reading frame 17 n=1 Tax=Chinchilla lanigera TaxID=34839 RepID=A0A8C2UMM6_CHILA|nr:PREDICTED: uncharacterized protein C4orf17 homolog [Chinchilla lanigera]
MHQGEGDHHTMAMNPGSPMSTQLKNRGNTATPGSGRCFLVRHTPHPRRVCHIKGLNNIPICTVKDDEIALRTLQEGGQLSHLEKNDIPPARGSCLPSPAAPGSLVQGVSPAPNSVKMPTRPHSEPSRKVNEFFKTSSDNPFVIKKEEFKAKNLPLPSKASSTAVSCSSEGSLPRSDVKEKTVCIPNYLEQEIKILAKLCDILHTDSLGEVLQWLLHASTKEKQWVSALVHSELAEINLTRCRRNRAVEPTPKAGKPPIAKCPPVNSPASPPAESEALASVREPARVPSQGSEGNKELPKGAEQKPPLFIRSTKMKIPVTEYFSKPKSPLRPDAWDLRSTKPMSARSVQHGLNLCPRSVSHPLTH